MFSLENVDIPALIYFQWKIEMDIEEELAELKAELEQTNENWRIREYVTSHQYRTLLKKQAPKICEVCGKEYRITHLCETIWNFERGELRKYYAAHETAAKSKKPSIPTYPKPTQPIKSPSSYTPQPKPQKKSSSNGCGVCMCVIVIVIILIFVF